MIAVVLFCPPAWASSRVGRDVWGFSLPHSLENKNPYFFGLLFGEAWVVGSKKQECDPFQVFPWSTMGERLPNYMDC